MRAKVLPIALILTAVTSCGGAVSSEAPPPEGEVTGFVTMRTGNFFDPSSIERSSVAARVRLYPLQPASAARRGRPNAPPRVETVSASADGRYTLRAPEGTYTLLVDYNDHLYPPDHDEWWNSVVIVAGTRTDADLTLNFIDD